MRSSLKIVKRLTVPLPYYLIKIRWSLVTIYYLGSPGLYIFKSYTPHITMLFQRTQEVSMNWVDKAIFAIFTLLSHDNMQGGRISIYNIVEETEKLIH